MSQIASWRRSVVLASLFAFVTAFAAPARADYELGRGYSLLDGRLIIGGYFSLENALRSVARAELERIDRKHIRFWLDATTIFPLNLPGSDPLRLAFSAEILRSDEHELAIYWNREYFQGVAPPAVLQSSRAVRTYVAATPGAIGYVSPEVVDSSVIVVEVTSGR